MMTGTGCGRISVVALTVAAALLLAACGSGDNGPAGSASGTGTGGVPVQAGGFPVHVGEVGPIAADNPLQEPFACATQDSPLGQPVVDNDDGIGLPVTDGSGTVLGYSANCGAPMKVLYFYRASGDADSAALRPYDPANPPGDVAQLTVNGQAVPFIVRFEIGTLNRFIYSITSLAPKPNVADPGVPDESAWNHDLVYYFNGGVGIGHSQASGAGFVRKVFTPAGQPLGLTFLEHGYAIVNSTGTAAETTYNLKLDGETAHMVKQQFVAEFGKPDHTFGFGGSGGAIQQLIYAQNVPGLLDALIPVKPFQDMITQLNPVGDCALLEYYFNAVDAQVNGTGTVDPKWKSWAIRQDIVGLHGIDGFHSGTTAALQQVGASVAGPGSSVCMEEWFGAVPQFMNPLYGGDSSFSVINPALLALTPISFFDDLEPIFGAVPGTGLARQTFDNVGVQYGLEALKEGIITPDEFLDINAHVGGYKPRQQFVAPGYPFEGQPTPDNLDPWSSRNATARDHLDPTDVAPRTAGSIPAMQAAYKAGLVFRGTIKQPVIIIQAYLEPKLNEHASRESFAVRQRMIDGKGNADNLAIWMIGADFDADGDGTPVLAHFALQALHDETQWLDSGARPAQVKNACYDGQGALLAAGPTVFRGETFPDGSGVPLRRDPADQGVCTKIYPIYSDARVIAGDDVGEHVVFKCALKPVLTALADGTYGSVSFSAVQQARLNQIFPTGVCDYSQPDQGLPTGG